MYIFIINMRELIIKVRGLHGLYTITIHYIQK